MQLKGIRFENPQFSVRTTFDRNDFTRILTDQFGVEREQIDGFFNTARSMNFYDDQEKTTRELFEEFFPGRDDVVRLLMEPITYANGSTLDDPAITYGIVFSNFMHKGVFTFEGGTDALVGKMKDELLANGVDLRIRTLVEKIEVDSNQQVSGVVVNGRRIGCRAVVSNANIRSTILDMVGSEHFDRSYIDETRNVRLNSSSCQVYMGLKPGEGFDREVGDLLFHSEHNGFDIDAILSMNVSSRTFSFYYPDTRPGSDRSLIVSSTNANYRDWADLSESDYQAAKADLEQTTLDCLEQYVPDIRSKLDHIEAATPMTFEHYTRHVAGSSFGTKFEGLKVSQELPKQIGGLYHAGSVGIIMSGWLGAVNYGVIVSNEVDKLLASQSAV